MKTLQLFLLLLLSHQTLSQQPRRIEIDKTLSIEVPGKVFRDSSANTISVTCETHAGVLLVDRIILPSDLVKNNTTVDVLEPFSKGYMASAEDGNKIEMLENKSLTINNTKARTLVYRNQEGQTVQVTFVLFKDRVYRVKFKQTLASSDAERVKLFESLRIL